MSRDATPYAEMRGNAVFAGQLQLSEQQQEFIKIFG